MSKQEYSTLDIRLGTELAEAVKALHDYQDEHNSPAKLCFNGVWLYSDSVTLDSAHLAIVGMSYNAYKNYLKRSGEMNAQEAIENMESKLNQLNDIKLRLESEGKTEEKDYINLCENIKAFSIVLESAKLLHRPYRMIASHEIYKTEQGKEAVKLLDINNSVFTCITIEEAKKIGLEGGADE